MTIYTVRDVFGMIVEREPSSNEFAIPAAPLLAGSEDPIALGGTWMRRASWNFDLKKFRDLLCLTTTFPVKVKLSSGLILNRVWKIACRRGHLASPSSASTGRAPAEGASCLDCLLQRQEREIWG